MLTPTLLLFVPVVIVSRFAFLFDRDPTRTNPPITKFGRIADYPIRFFHGDRSGFGFGALTCMLYATPSQLWLLFSLRYGYGAALRSDRIVLYPAKISPRQ